MANLVNDIGARGPVKAVEVNDGERIAVGWSNVGEIWTVGDGADVPGRNLLYGGSEIRHKQLSGVGSGHGRPEFKFSPKEEKKKREVILKFNSRRKKEMRCCNFDSNKSLLL